MVDLNIRFLDSLPFYRHARKILKLYIILEWFYFLAKAIALAIDGILW